LEVLYNPEFTIQNSWVKILRLKLSWRQNLYAQGLIKQREADKNKVKVKFATDSDVVDWMENT
jgi:hypothetical protein